MMIEQEKEPNGEVLMTDALLGESIAHFKLKNFLMAKQSID